jgi:hypothetical protein
VVKTRCDLRRDRSFNRLAALLRAVLNGRGDEVIELTQTNLLR